MHHHWPATTITIIIVTTTIATTYVPTRARPANSRRHLNARVIVVAASAVGLGRVQLPRQRATTTTTKKKKKKKRGTATGRRREKRDGERREERNREGARSEREEGRCAPIPRPRRTSNPGWTWLLVYPSFSPCSSLSSSLFLAPIPLSRSFPLSLFLCTHAASQGTLPACAFHARFLRSILDRAESTEATERDSIGGILRLPPPCPILPPLLGTVCASVRPMSRCCVREKLLFLAYSAWRRALGCRTIGAHSQTR